jgi:excinuclease UvrABC ATPase subunit
MNHEGLGLEHATLRWNAVSESAKRSTGTPIVKAAAKQKKRIRTPSSSDDEASTTIADSSDESGSEEEGDRSFRLRDVSVLFPEGALTVVTGPTASGKTALLVWCLSFSLSFYIL